MQRYALAAVKDGLDQTTLKTLASLATWGKHQQNSERDFHRVMPFLYDCDLQTHSVCLDIWDSDKGVSVPTEIPVLLASDVLHQLWEKKSPKLWTECIGATSQKTHAFWESHRLDPASWSHPVFEPSGSNEFFL